MPIVIAPTGLAGLFWPDGERCAARAANEAGIAYCLSHGSVCTLEELAATGVAPRWMQVFIYKDRAFTRELAERAAKAGYDALVLTIDNQLLGNRERDIRNGFSIPPQSFSTLILFQALQIKRINGWIDTPIPWNQNENCFQEDVCIQGSYSKNTTFAICYFLR